MTELVIFTAILGIVFILLFGVTLRIFTALEIPMEIVIVWVLFTGNVIASTIMVILAAFILVKRRFRRHSVVQQGTRTADDDFQKLVALVALLFCFCKFMAAVHLVRVLVLEDKLSARESFYWGTAFAILNSSVNLFIYLIASRNFRNAFLEFCKSARTES